MEVAFVVDEGPKVDVGTITILGNKAFSRREVVNAMKNLKPIGIPHSIFFEELFPQDLRRGKAGERDKERDPRRLWKRGLRASPKVLDQTVKFTRNRRPAWPDPPSTDQGKSSG